MHLMWYADSSRAAVDRVVAGALRELLPTYWLWLTRIDCSLIIANYVYHRVCDVSVRMHECAVSRALLMSYAWFNAFYALSVRRSVSAVLVHVDAPPPEPHTPLMLTFVYRPVQNIHSLHNEHSLYVYTSHSPSVCGCGHISFHWPPLTRSWC